MAADGKRHITVLLTGDCYCVEDWIDRTDAAGRPVAIHLASLLVQEEFFILRRRGRYVSPNESDQAGPPLPVGQMPEPYAYEFCAGTSCLNFIRSGIKGERGAPLRCAAVRCSAASHCTRSLLCCCDDSCSKDRSQVEGGRCNRTDGAKQPDAQHSQAGAWHVAAQLAPPACRHLLGGGRAHGVLPHQLRHRP